MDGVFDIGSVVVKVKADLSSFEQGIAQAKDEASGLGSHVGQVFEDIKGFAEQAAIVVGAQTLAFGELAKKAIEVASNFEQTQTSFGTLLGSEQKAADLMKQLMAFEVNTPFSIGTLSDAAKQLLAFGVSADEVVPKLKQLTDMSQGQTYKLQELVSIYGEVNSIQQLNGREVLRLSSIGIPIYQAIADYYNKMGSSATGSGTAISAMHDVIEKGTKKSSLAMEKLNDSLVIAKEHLSNLEAAHVKAGTASLNHATAIEAAKFKVQELSDTIAGANKHITTMGGSSEITAEQVKKMISSGQITAKVFGDVLNELTSKGGLYFNENIRQMSTFNGIMSSITSQTQYAILNLMGIDIGAANEVRKGGLFDTLRTLAAGLLDGLKNLQPMLKGIGENKTFQLAIEGLVIALASLVVILPVVILALNPVALVVFAVEAAVIALYVAWNTNFLGIRDITQQIGATIGNFFQNYLKPAIESLARLWRDNWQYIKDFFVGVWYFVQGAIQIGWAVIFGIIEVGLALLTGNWDKAWSAVKDNLSIAWQGIQNILWGGLIMIGNFGALLIKALVAPFQAAWNTISDIMNKVRDALDFTKRHSPSVLDIVQNGVGLVNNALQGINFTPNISASQIANNIFTPLSSVSLGSVNPGNAITVNLPNAIVSDSATAAMMGEKIGNAIVAKLKQNVRF